MDPRYAGRGVALFARERGIPYRFTVDTEAGRAALDAQAEVLIEAAYDLKPGSVGRALDGGGLDVRDSGPPAGSPEIVQRLWGHEHVRTLWGLNLPEDHRLELVESYAATLNPGTPDLHRERA
jgi:hypothetical protein